MENMQKILDQLQEYFEETPQDILEKEWHEYNKYNSVGPTVNNFLNNVDNYYSKINSLPLPLESAPKPHFKYGIEKNKNKDSQASTNIKNAKRNKK